MKKSILYHGKWYKKGDPIVFKEEPCWLLFWQLPFFRSKKMKVGYIGEDAGAALIPLKANSFNELVDRSICGNVIIEN